MYGLYKIKRAARDFLLVNFRFRIHILYLHVFEIVSGIRVKDFLRPRIHLVLMRKLYTTKVTLKSVFGVYSFLYCIFEFFSNPIIYIPKPQHCVCRINALFYNRFFLLVVWRVCVYNIYRKLRF